MKRILITAALLTGFASSPALAQTKIGDWTVEKRPQDEHCIAIRGYKDSTDNNLQYLVTFSYAQSDKIVIVMIYQGWEWDKPGEVLKADFGTDSARITKDAKWEVMDKTAVRGVFEFDQVILDKLSRAKKLTVDFEDDDDDSIEMLTPRSDEALAAMKFCEENRK